MILRDVKSSRRIEKWQIWTGVKRRCGLNEGTGTEIIERLGMNEGGGEYEAIL